MFPSHSSERARHVVSSWNWARFQILSWGLLFLLLNSCAKSNSGSNSTEPSSGSHEAQGRVCEDWISGKEAMRIVEDGGLLLDVRTRQEFSEGHLDGAKNIPVQELESRLDEIPGNTHVVVYCRSGKRAERAAEILQKDDRQVSEIGHMGQYQAHQPAGCSEP